MACAPVFSSSRRRRSPLAGAFFPPVDLSDLALIRALAIISSDLTSSSNTSIPFQRRNYMSLVLKVKIFLALFEFLRDSPTTTHFPPPANLCFKELYILLYRVKALLDYCSQSSRLWLLLQNTQISGYFHDLTLEVTTLLDVFPIEDISLAADVREQLELLRRQARRSKLFIDPRDEVLRLKIYAFLDEFESGRAPDLSELQLTFVEQLGIRDARTCRAEIEFLEEQIYGQEEEVDLSVLGGVVSLIRHCRFLLFGFGPECGEKRKSGSSHGKKSMKGVVCQAIGEAFLTVPKDFCCPISLEIMTDPVIIASGQTFDRSSISRWMDEGHSTCPSSGQTLVHTRLVPNRALRSLISQWCLAHGVSYEPPESATESVVVPTMSRAAAHANRATANLLIQQLDVGTEDAKAVSARELRLLAKTGKENRVCIAEAGAIPLLRRLLSSTNPVTQENSVTALLNLSIHDSNKSRIMEEEGCLTSVVDVLRHGLTVEARENAAAALFSLSAVHDYKKQITDEDSALEALAGLLREGTPRGKKDAVMALFNLSTHSESSARIVRSGSAAALVEALGTEGISEEAAAALALLVRQRGAAEAVSREDKAVPGLVELMRRGSPKAKENAVAALVEICRGGGAAVTMGVANAPALGGLIQTLLFTGTKRARRKAASLARMFQRHEVSGSMPFGGWAMQYALARSRSLRRSSNFDGRDAASVSVSVAISVPVL